MIKEITKPEYSKADDLWYVGFILYEIQCFASFLIKRNADKFYNKILQVERETDSTNKGAKEVCSKCASPMRYVLFCSNPGCSNSDGF